MSDQNQIDGIQTVHIAGLDVEAMNEYHREAGRLAARQNAVLDAIENFFKQLGEAIEAYGPIVQAQLEELARQALENDDGEISQILDALGQAGIEIDLGPLADGPAGATLTDERVLAVLQRYSIVPQKFMDGFAAVYRSTVSEQELLEAINRQMSENDCDFDEGVLQGVDFLLEAGADIFEDDLSQGTYLLDRQIQKNAPLPSDDSDDSPNDPYSPLS